MKLRGKGEKRGKKGEKRKKEREKKEKKKKERNRAIIKETVGKVISIHKS